MKIDHLIGYSILTLKSHHNINNHKILPYIFIKHLNTSNLKYQQQFKPTIIIQTTQQMTIIEKVDKHKCFELIAGIIGINVTFLIGGVLYQWITKIPYMNIHTGKQQLFRSSVGLIAAERGLTWMFAEIYGAIFVKKQDKVKIPSKNVAICGFIIFLSSITFTQAIYLVSFPLTIMSKSCSILSVILVGVFCSRVRDKKLKLSHKKIIVAIIVSSGIVMFRFFDPEANLADQKRSELLGYFFLFASLLADGFIPDFQAQIKQKYKPLPTDMLLQINKWSFICCMIYALIMNHLWYTFTFCMQHPLLTIHLFSLSALTFIGQIFVYRLIKQFKQHIVPFVVTTRKILTVGFSLVYFGHRSSVGQVLGIVMVFIVTIYQFLSEILKDENNKTQSGSMNLNKQNATMISQQENNKLNSKQQNQHSANNLQMLQQQS